MPYIGDLIGYRTPARRGPESGKPARRSRAHHRLSTAQRHRDHARTTGARRHRLAGAGGRVLSAARLDAKHESYSPAKPITRPNLRDWEKLERLNTALRSQPATRSTCGGSPRARASTIFPISAIFLWRLGAYRVRGSPAVPAAPGDTQRFLLRSARDATRSSSPGRSGKTRSRHLAEPINVPDPISRRVLAQYLTRYYGEREKFGAATAWISRRSIFAI